MAEIALLHVDGHLDEAQALGLLASLKSLPGKFENLGAIILRLRVAGGSLGAAQAAAEGVAFFREELEIPVVALVIESALSAGYYLAASCDHIVAAEAALIGGVGAITRNLNFSELMSKIGIEYSCISSGDGKDMYFPLATRNAVQNELVGDIVNEQSKQFLKFIQFRRALNNAHIDEIRNGCVFNGSDALQYNLIDEIGGFFAAISACVRIGKMDDMTIQSVEPYNQSQSVSNAFLSSLAALMRI